MEAKRQSMFDPASQLVPASHCRSQILLDDGTDVDLDSLVFTGQCSGKVRQVLAVVHHTLAQELEWKDAGLAVGSPGNGLENCNLLHVCCDGDDIVTRNEKQILDVQGSDSFISNEVGERNVALTYG